MFTSQELGTHKPTQFLRRLQQLLGNRPTTDDLFFAELFLQRLLSEVRMVLASTPESTKLDLLAELTDKVTEVATPRPGTIAGITEPPPSVIDKLREDVSHLEKLVHKLSRSHSPCQTSRFTHRSPTPQSTESFDSPTTTSGTLSRWYHHKFGKKAQKCKVPQHLEVKLRGRSLAATNVAGLPWPTVHRSPLPHIRL